MDKNDKHIEALKKLQVKKLLDANKAEKAGDKEAAKKNRGTAGGARRLWKDLKNNKSDYKGR